MSNAEDWEPFIRHVASTKWATDLGKDFDLAQQMEEAKRAAEAAPKDDKIAVRISFPTSVWESLLDAWAHYQDHKCQSAIAVLDAFLEWTFDGILGGHE